MNRSDGAAAETTCEVSNSTTTMDFTEGKHGTRPPIPQLHLESLPDVGTAFVTDEDPNLRPPPAPSIPDEGAEALQPIRKPRKGCLKVLSPLPSPSIPSSSPSPSSDTYSIQFTLGGDNSSSSSLDNNPCSTPRKFVSWCDERDSAFRCLEEIFPADDWDRTATEPARTPLSYKDILELKAIQRSLPCAQQLPDPYTGKPVNQYLTNVPIALLPLLPDSAPQTPLTTPNMSPNNSSGGTPYGSGSSSPTDLSPKDSTTSSPRLSPRVSPIHSPASRSPNRSPERSSNSTPTCLQPAYMVHTHAPRISSPLAPSPSPPSYSYPSPLPPPPPSASSPVFPRSRPKPTFMFLPLLETPVASPAASAPVSPPNNPTADPQALDAALGKLCEDPSYSLNEDGTGSPPTPALTVTSLNGDSCSEVDTELSDIGDDIPFGVSFKRNLNMSYESNRRGRERGRDKERTIKAKPKKKRNVILINGEEVDLDGDDDNDDNDEKEEKQSRTPSPIESASSSNIIYINGEACSLDDDEPSLPQTSHRTPSLSPSSSTRMNRARTPSPDPNPHSERRRQSPISPFHRAHPNLSRTPSPDTTMRSASPLSPFHQAHPNLKLRSLTPDLTTS